MKNVINLEAYCLGAVYGQGSKLTDSRQVHARYIAARCEIVTESSLDIEPRSGFNRYKTDSEWLELAGQLIEAKGDK